MNAALNPADQSAISALSRTEVEITAAGLKKFFKRNIWIGKTNSYGNNVVQEIKNNPPVTPQQKRNLAQYIAASVVLHANDGWSYLGRAFACVLAGDSHRALHLAYYAELRAAMSLLAGVGVGIFNRVHFVVPAANTIDRLTTKIGTHEIAWLALEHWAQQPSSGSLFAKLIRPEGRSLEDWFHGLGGASALAPQARSWFMQWGMDLSHTLDDREARNVSSYRPDGIPDSWHVNPTESLEFASDTWRVLEPSGVASFAQIDLFILRTALERFYFAKNGVRASASNASYSSWITTIVSRQGFTMAAEDRLKEFLLRTTNAEDPLVFRYSALRPAGRQDDPFSVLSRAVLLLRLATGSAQDLLNQAGVGVGALAFWWEKLGEARGLWPPGSPPSPLSDLWADIDSTLEDIRVADPASLSSIGALADLVGRRSSLFCSHERVGLWGLSS